MGTSSGPAGKEVSYHGAVGGSSVSYKPPSQHSPQPRGLLPIFPQEPPGSATNSPPLHINICGQVSYGDERGNETQLFFEFKFILIL